MSHDINHGLTDAAYRRSSQPNPTMDGTEDPVNELQAARPSNQGAVDTEASDAVEPPFDIKEAKIPQSANLGVDLPARKYSRSRSATPRLSIKPTVGTISDHSYDGYNGMDQTPQQYDIVEKTHRITTDDEGNTTAEETIMRRVSVGRNEQGDEYRIEREEMVNHPVAAGPLYGESEGRGGVPAGPRYQHPQYRIPPRNMFIPVGEDDRADERPPVRRAPRPMIYRHGRSDSPPFLSEMYELPNAPMPIMYSSVPVKSAALSRRAAKKGREQSDVYTLTSDDDYELYPYQSNVNRFFGSLIGREVRQDKKKRRALISPPKKTWKDAAHSCAIEVDDDGCLLTVILTDDLVGSDLRFGRQHIMFYPEADRLELGPPPILPHKRRPRSYKVGMRYNAPQHEYITAAEVTGELRGKKVKVKRRRLKSKRHTHDLIHVPVGHDILTRHEVNPYDDEVLMELKSVTPGSYQGPDLYSANAVYMVPEEITKEVPIGIQAFARDRIARWTQDSSSESEEEELPPPKPPKSLSERGVLTEADWRFRMEEEDSKRRATMRRANQQELERLKALDSRISYTGGQPVYIQKVSMTGKQTLLPDMYPYSMPSQMTSAAERRRASQPYHPDNY